jgi:SpoVK/Ycf46/Vps4 family AAA+-type ATPase
MINNNNPNNPNNPNNTDSEPETNEPNNSNNSNNSNNKKKKIDEIEHIDRVPPKRFKLIIEALNKKNVDNEKGFLNTPKAHFICGNILCDHKKHLTKWSENNKVNIVKVNTLDELIKLAEYYHCRMRKTYNGIDLKILFEITDYLKELNSMIGLSNIKEEIVNMIIYLLIMKNSEKGLNSDMLHAVVTGSPGCGKTTFIEVIAKIYTKLGVLTKGHIVKAKRSDLIGKYLGHTSVQTQNKINDAKGGILLIDEAYSLGNPEGRDSFSKECIDTINQALSEDKSEFICIIAGYKDALDSSFFSYNEGLRRRFPFRFDICKYSSEELSKIFMKKIIEYNFWKLEFTQDSLDKLIKTNFINFENQGGDMETLFLNLKIVNNKRVFLLPIDDKKKLLIKDIKDSIDKFIFLKGDYLKNKREIPFGLYV